MMELYRAFNLKNKKEKEVMDISPMKSRTSIVIMCWPSNLESLSRSMLIIFNGFFLLMIVAVISHLAISTLLGTIVPRLYENKYDLNVDGIGQLNQIIYTVFYINPGLCGIVFFAGIFTFILCFMGCYGACATSRIVLYMYGIIIIPLELLYVLVNLMIFIYRDEDFEKFIKTNMWKQLGRYNPTFNIDDSNWRSTDVVDVMQHMYHCCGVVSYQDWRHSTHLSLTSSVPDSCCVKYESDCGYNYFDNPQDGLIYTEGCYLEGRDYIMNFVGWPWSFIASVVIHLLCVVGAFYLGSHDSDWKEEFGSGKEE